MDFPKKVNAAHSAFHSSPDLSKLRRRSPVQYGRSTGRRLSSDDVIDIKHRHSYKLIREMIQCSVEMLEVEVFESTCELLALKTFPVVLDEDTTGEDTKKSVGFSLNDCRCPEETTIFETMLTLNQLEVLNICLKVLFSRIEQSSEMKQKQVGDLLETIREAQGLIKRFQYLFKEHLEGIHVHGCMCILESTAGSLQKACSQIAKKTQKEKKMKGNEYMLDEDKDRICRKTVRLCSLLGLRLDFLDHLEKISPRIRNHRSFSEWIVTFLREDYESLPLPKKNSLNKELLLSIGFDSTSSTVETVLARSRAGNMQQHIEPCEWAEIYIEDEFKYNVLLNPQTDRFPFQSDSINTWFLQSSEIENGETTHVEIINLVIDKFKFGKTAYSKLLDQSRKLELEQHVVLFHGTDHESAKDILVRGIDLSAGRQKRDFSSGLGFYLTKNCSDVVSWAKSTTAKPAILMFHVKRRCLNRFRNQIFLETSADDMTKWHDIVSSFRSGKLKAEIQNLLTEFDSIEGPTAIITGRTENDELRIEPKQSSHQLCLFSEDLANELQKSLH